MDANKAKSLVAAITSTLWEVSPDRPVPKTPIYLAMGMDFGAWETIQHVLVCCGLVVVTADTIVLTDQGRDIGRRCSQVYQSAEAVSA